MSQTLDHPLDHTLDNIRGCKRERKRNAQALPPGLTHEMMNKYVVYYRETFEQNGKTKMREYFKVEGHPKLLKISAKPWISTKSGKVYLAEKLGDANQVVVDLENNIYPSSHYNAETNDNVLELELKSASTEETSSVSRKAEQIKKWSKLLPKYVSIRDVREIHPIPTPNPRDYFNITFDKKDTTNMFRWTASHRFCIQGTSTSTSTTTSATIDDVSLISHEIQKLREKIILKYGMDMLSIS
jgi:hypothetical protein